MSPAAAPEATTRVQGEGDHHHGQRGDKDDDHADEDDDNDGEDDHKTGCDATKMTTGATVGEAELEATPAGLVFEKIEIVG